jgi:hypothetical protein
MGCFSTSGLPLGTWVWVIEMLFGDPYRSWRTPIPGHCVNEISKLPIGTWTERPERGRREGKGKGRKEMQCARAEETRERERWERRGEKRRSSEHFRELWSFSRVHAFRGNLLQQTALEKPFPMTLLWSFCAMVASQVLYLRPFTDGVQRSLGVPGVA